MKRRTFIHTLAASTYGLKAIDAKEVPIASKAKNVIYICLDGGMSHIDTFDPKDDKDVMGNTTKISTNVSGIELGNRLPKLANIVDKMSIIRSTTSKTGAHEQAQYLNRTSYRQIGSIVHPSLGSWVAHIQDRERDIPDYVLISGSSAHPNSGFLPKVKSPLPIVDPQGGLKNSKVDSKLEERMRILRELNSSLKAPLASEYNQFYDNTVRFLKSKDLELFDLTKESSDIRAKYGDTRLGQGCLLAKRLIKGDIKFIEINNGGWDTHVDNFTKLDNKLKEVDDALSALVLDLDSEGLLDSTLIALVTEFGRTPNINVNEGRDHHPQCYSTVLIGAGVKGGYIAGETNKTASKVTKDPYTISDINATIAHLLGIQTEEDRLSPSGRPFKVANKGDVIKDILG
ncbi:MAG: hypothetical protein CMN06_12100 [Roseibacillus sp.]|nr:hypothetical protein [Roseibacillus sp.]|tara:strand:- start:2331 stop:3533 length:1203 start_codon:yes stop_codon:yes gene_type:complete